MEKTAEQEEKGHNPSRLAHLFKTTPYPRTGLETNIKAKQPTHLPSGNMKSDFIVTDASLLPYLGETAFRL